ncbi:hypothetical protein Tco_1084702, partial [Tanacetum coccineum]
MGDENPIRILGDYSKPSHEGYRNTIELPVGNNVAPLQSDTIRRTINQSASGKLCDLNAKESWELLEDLALYDNESWNDPRDFAKPVKAITLPQYVPSTSDRRLIELESQICSGPHDTQYCIEDPEQAFVEYTSSRTDEVGGKRFTLNHGPRNFNDAANTWKEKPNFNWAHTQTFTNPQGGSASIYSSSYQIKLEKALLDFDSHQEIRLSHLKTQLGQQQDDMIGKINLLWKTVSEKLNDASLPENVVNSLTPKSITAISHDEREELQKKGIKILSKLLSPKYLSPASINELNKNLSAPKRVHFVNSIIILSADRKEGVKQENEMETDMEVDEVIEEEESEFETDEEVEEILEEEEDDEDGKNFNLFPTMEELTHHEWLLKNTRPPWVK